MHGHQSSNTFGWTAPEETVSQKTMRGRPARLSHVSISFSHEAVYLYYRVTHVSLCSLQRNKHNLFQFLCHKADSHLITLPLPATRFQLSGGVNRHRWWEIAMLHMVIWVKHQTPWRSPVKTLNHKNHSRVTHLGSFLTLVPR